MLQQLIETDTFLLKSGAIFIPKCPNNYKATHNTIFVCNETNNKDI